MLTRSRENSAPVTTVLRHRPGVEFEVAGVGRPVTLVDLIAALGVEADGPAAGLGLAKWPPSGAAVRAGALLRDGADIVQDRISSRILLLEVTKSLTFIRPSTVPISCCTFWKSRLTKP